MKKQTFQIIDDQQKIKIYIYYPDKWKSFIGSLTLFSVIFFVAVLLFFVTKFDDPEITIPIRIGACLLVLLFWNRPLRQIFSILEPRIIIISKDSISTSHFGKLLSFSASKITNMQFENFHLKTTRRNRLVPSIMFSYGEKRIPLADNITPATASILLAGPLHRFVAKN